MSTPLDNVFGIAGNNVPALTSTASPKETLEFVRLIVDRKRNSFPGYGGDENAGADGFNRAIVEIEEEIDLYIRKLEASLT